MRKYFIATAVVLIVSAVGYNLAPLTTKNTVLGWFGVNTPNEVGKGEFRGRLEVMFESIPTGDGKVVELIMLKKPFGYTDSKGVDWDVPSGYISNGASIPPMLWSVVGAPLSGPYLYAAVLHDYYCETQDRPWQQVHEMFFEAAVSRGTDVELAKILYAGILLGGPRWNEKRVELFTPDIKKAQVLPTSGFNLFGGEAMAQENRENKLPFETKDKSPDEIFTALQEWIKQEKPTKEEIDAVVQQVRKITIEKSQ